MGCAHPLSYHPTLMASSRRATSYDRLAGAEPVFAALIRRYGRPDPFAFHDGGRTEGSLFAALFLHIVGQQISALVSFLVYDRVAELTEGPPTPAALLALGPGKLRSCGLSEPKARYVIALSQMQMDGLIDVEDMSGLDDAEAIAALSRVPGVGRWTAQTFLIHQLHRPDVLPAGDSGICRAIRTCWRLDSPPTTARVEAMGERWAPDRSYAAGLLWRSLYPPGEPSDPKERALLKLEAQRGATR